MVLPNEINILLIQEGFLVTTFHRVAPLMNQNSLMRRWLIVMMILPLKLLIQIPDF